MATERGFSWNRDYEGELRDILRQDGWVKGSLADSLLDDALDRAHAEGMREAAALEAPAPSSMTGGK